jgi:hypothetical protein
MRFVSTADQREFFRKNQFIELEDLLTAAQVKALDAQAQELLEARLKISAAKWDSALAPALYKGGFDLWRDVPQIKKATQKLSIAHIASELFDTTPLRIAFDQFCVSIPSSAPFASDLSLTEISSIKPLAGGILFPLTDLPVEQNPAFPLPQKMGSALFFSPKIAIPWTQLFSVPWRFLLVAFAPKKSFYRPEPNDVHSPLFKKRGYVFNDLLKEEFHPLVYGKK